MSKIFFIPGLGANELVFDNIENLPLEKVNVKWLENEGDESINSYALKLIKTYKINENHTVAGLSFGGILAQEIARILELDKVVLISSLRDIQDLRSVYRFGLKTGLYRLAPNFRIPVIDEIIAYNLNSNNQKSKPILKKMLEQTDYGLLKWSLQKIADLPKRPKDNFTVYNIIGDNDKILKPWQNEHTTIIDGGSHFMVYEKAEEVTLALIDILK